MHTAMRIDFTRSYIGGSDARIFALALASGVAGLTVTYPTITLGNGTVGEWTGGFEVRGPRLVVPEMSITARFSATTAAAANTAKMTATNLAEALAPASKPLAGRNALGNAVRAPISTRPAERLTPPAKVASLPSPAVHIAGYTPTGAAAEPADPVAPLDAVRIVLPPVATDLSTAGAMPPQATLNSVSAARPAQRPETKSLADSMPAQAHSISAPGAMSEAQPFNLLSAPEEVREFDLAKLGEAKVEPNGLARSAVDALTAAEPAGTRNLPKVAKVPDRIAGDHILHIAGLSLEGVPAGNLSVRIGMSGDLSVKLGDLLAPVQDQIAQDTFERLANSSAASEYVSFAQLRAAGFDVRYDAGNDRLLVSAQP